MEIKISCPVCNMHTAFQTTEQNIESYLCFTCGYTSNSLFTEESEKLAALLKTTSELIKDLKVFDTVREIYWFPSVINMGRLGIIFPEGTLEDWKWKYARVVDVGKDEEMKYRIPDKPGEYYETKLDVDNAEIFGRLEFLQACKAMGIAREVGGEDSALNDFLRSNTQVKMEKN
jgi:Zn ribbon nucleic-acid-binding protein